MEMERERQRLQEDVGPDPAPTPAEDSREENVSHDEPLDVANELDASVSRQKLDIDLQTDALPVSS